jgi:hypothetical protein
MLPLALAVILHGTVVDPTGAGIPGATVRAEQASSQTDAAGAFRLSVPAAGTYSLKVSHPQFKGTLVRVRTGKPVTIQLRVADLHQQITVDDQAVPVSENLDVVQLDREMLDNLPVLDNDPIAAAQRFLDPASGTSLVVDGMEASELGIAPSAIQEIRINQNPYSAEFSRPGRGRIEVVTRQDAPNFRGALSVRLRDHRLDARNAFAESKPPQQRRGFEGHLTGPLGRATGFLLSFERDEDRQYGIVYARTPAGLHSETVLTPESETEFSARVFHRWSESHSSSLRWEIDRQSELASGAGGFTLPEAASDQREREQAVYFSHQSVFSPALLLQAQSRLELGESRVTSRSAGPKIVVLDSFTGGGAQADRRYREAGADATAVLSWTVRGHVVKTGLAVLEAGPSTYTDLTNRAGTFSYSSLEDYLAQRPFALVRQEGDGHVRYSNPHFGSFVQADLRLNPRLSLGLGLRHELSYYPAGRNNFAPRLSLAYAPGEARKTVLRAGIGMFYDRTDSSAVRDMRLLDGMRLRQYICPAAGCDGGRQPSTILLFAPDLESPQLLHYSLGLERRLSRRTSVSITYFGARGRNLFRSRDLNAPVAGVRPDPDAGLVQQLESSAGMNTHSLDISLRGDLSRYFRGGVRYVLGRAYNDTGGSDSLPPNSYDLSGEWSPSDFDRTHRFDWFGSFEAGRWFQLGVSLELESGRPYTIITGIDENRDGAARERPPGVRRNSLRGPAEATLDLRWSRDFPLGAEREFTVAFDVFNVLNRVNYSGYVGNLSSPFFGRPVSADAARRLQLSARFRF